MSTFNTSREIPADVERVFAAIAEPARLARWWGPAGFTNTFHECRFEPGGRWSLTMHGPDGRGYANESVFEAIERPTRVVVRHVSRPEYRLTITLTASGAGTVVSWSQAFDNPEVGRKLERIVVPANEQNLDRLTAEVMRDDGGG